MSNAQKLGAKGKRLLQVLVNEINSGRIQENQRRTFVPYSEAAMLIGLPDPEIVPGRRLQKEGLNELNEWTKASHGIPHIAGLIVNKDTWIPSEGYPESHGFKIGEDWEDWWLKQTAAAIKFKHWSRYLK